MTNNHFSIFVLVALLFHCIPSPEIYEPDVPTQIGVFGLVSPDSSYEFVIVEKTLTIDEYNRYTYADDPMETIIRNAKVDVMTEQDTARFVLLASPFPASHFHYEDYYQNALYIDYHHHLNPGPGKRCWLRVTVPDGRIITGETCIPHPPRIISPKNGLHLRPEELANLQVAWEESPFAAGYKLFCIVSSSGGYNMRRDILNGLIVHHPPVNLGEKIPIKYLEEMGDAISDTLVLKIMALDRNYFDYLRTIDSELIEMTGINLNIVKGGVGVFGSVSIDSINIILHRGV